MVATYGMDVPCLEALDALFSIQVAIDRAGKADIVAVELLVPNAVWSHVNWKD
jgi:hypothetical protein